MTKKLKFLAITILVGNLTFSQAPTIQWQKCFGGSGSDSVNDFQPTSDGGYILTGYSDSNDGDVTGNHGNGDYWVVKLNSIGAIQWQKSLGGSSYDEAAAIQQTSDGGYIVAGNSSSDNGDVTGNHGSSDYWIVKLNNNGFIQWQKSLGGSGTDWANSILQTSDGGYIVAGDSYSNNGDVTGNHGSLDYLIVKLNSSGVIQWQKSFGGSNADQAYVIKQTSDGGYIVTGYSDSNNGDVTGNHGDKDSWIVKLSGSGTIQWQKTLGGNGFEEGNAIQQTSDGGYILAGYSNSNNEDVTGNHGKVDCWVVKLNSTGFIQWQKSLGGSSDDYATSIQPTSDGGYIVAGSSYSTNGDVSVNHGDADYWIVKLSSSGVIKWQKALGGNYYDNANVIQPTSDGGYIVAGLSSSNNGDVSGNHGLDDYWIVKLNPENLSTNETALKNTVFVENPVKDLLKIQSQEKITSLQLYSANGQLIKTSNSQNMSVKELSKGVFILKIKLENGTVVSEKVIKE